MGMSTLERLLADPGLEEAVKEMCRPARWYRYFNQAVSWVPDGRPAVVIAEMDLTWRYNCTRYLVRNVERYARMYADGAQAEALVARLVTGLELPEAVLDRLDSASHLARSNPAAWVVTTPLYRALARELPTGAELRKLSRRAAHWSECEGRLRPKKGNCTCAELAARHARDKHQRELELAEATRPWE